MLYQSLDVLPAVLTTQAIPLNVPAMMQQSEEFTRVFPIAYSDHP
jgi:hypothetical protein